MNLLAIWQNLGLIEVLILLLVGAMAIVLIRLVRSLKPK